MFTLALLLSTSALAGDPATAIEKAKAAHGGAVLVAVAGPDAEKAVNRTLAQSPRLAKDVVVARIPLVGDVQREVERVLAQHDLSCAVRVAPLGKGFDTAQLGDCSPRAGTTAAAGATVAALPAPATAPATGSAAATASPGGTLTGPAAAIYAELMAMPDHGTRRALITAKLGTGALDADTAGRLGQALAVVGVLEGRGEGDPAVVGPYVAAALCDDAAVRATAISAASTGAPAPALPTNAASGSATTATAATGTLCIVRPFNVMGSAVGIPVVVGGQSWPLLRTGTAVAGTLAAGPVTVEVGAQGTGGTRIEPTIEADATAAFNLRLALGGMVLEPTSESETADACAKAKRP